jgi:hypothetical protein
MHDMMTEMMWGVGFGGLLLVILALLAIAALIKYAFSRKFGAPQAIL